MIELTERYDDVRSADAVLTLPFETRQKSRFRATLDDGRDAGVHLPRGSLLRDGDRLGGDGLVVRVAAAAEAVSTVTAHDPTTLARGAYHLGNRHVPLQVGEGWLRYRRDHVLDAMAAGLGLAVHHESAPFEPEAGAYGHGHGHSHHHHDHA
ncbi:Urease accessory protein UreE [wastewater metagenome]|uniref:Urease accessory protein UreE n=2 Tax=unclassified sequences TaxID=12908 RepID=A0A5B8RHJ5_9ZZZZ|nr:urease accessory protein UreE [Arhodomonas sp. KWT]QEA06395.1 urease accessory protein UreE [uncultured organism]